MIVGVGSSEAAFPYQPSRVADSLWNRISSCFVTKSSIATVLWWIDIFNAKDSRYGSRIPNGSTPERRRFP